MTLRHHNLSSAVALAIGLWSTSAAAQADDALSYQVHVDVVSRLFQRAAIQPGSGALVSEPVAAPLYHYALLRVDDLDLPWAEDSADVELSAWGDLQLGEPAEVGRFDGDIHILKARQRFEHGYVTLGRQVRAGGAARFVRFDGATAGARLSLPSDGLDTQLGIDGYGGFTVLPRWDAREGYHQLGSAADTLLRDPAVFAERNRSEQWLAGTRVYASQPGLVSAGWSFHEQRADAELAYRNTAFDLELTPHEAIALRGQAILDMDAAALSDARASADMQLHRTVSVSAVYQHLSPALLLSRQSVLSAFSTEAFDEWGGEGDYRPLRWLSVGAFGYVERFDSGAYGGRGGGQLRLLDHSPQRGMLSLGWRRVEEVHNGYHALRMSAGMRIIEPLAVTTDGYLYLYDVPIQRQSSSLLGILALAWQALEPLEVTLAGSLAQTPYASVDAQGLLRARIAFQGGER